MIFNVAIPKEKKECSSEIKELRDEISKMKKNFKKFKLTNSKSKFSINKLANMVVKYRISYPSFLYATQPSIVDILNDCFYDVSFTEKWNNCDFKTKKFIADEVDKYLIIN